MKLSLEDFRRRLIRAMGWGTVLVWFSFALIFQSLVMIISENQRTLAESRLGSALNSFVANQEGKLAIVASHPEFRTFLRSGPEGQAQLRTTALTLLSTLQDDELRGVSLLDSDQKTVLVELGETKGQVLGFDLCYIGDHLNAEFCRCSATALLYFGELSTNHALHSSEQIVSCIGCSKSIQEFLTKNTFLKVSQKTNFNVRYAPSQPNLLTIQLYFFIISLLLLGFGIFFRRLVGKTIKQDIINPLN